MTALFVTGTGTDVGKTFVTCLLIRQLRDAGRPVGAIKPVMTGYDPANAAESDAGLILAALGEPLTEAAIAAVSPWRFAAPLSPDMAAALERRSLDVAAVAAFCRAAAAGGGVLLVEGIGGVMVPLSGKRTVRDLIADLGWPALLVAGSYLGTLSHTLTAAEALSARSIPITGIVVSESPTSPVPLGETVARLAGLLAPIPVLAAPRRGVAPELAAPLGLSAVPAP